MTIVIVTVIVSCALLALFRKRRTHDRKAGTLAPGTRIVVAEQHSWAARAHGTVVLPPRPVKQCTKGGWKRAERVVHTPKGVHTTYWIEFDAPQQDSEGASQIIGAEIRATLLTVLIDQPPPPPQQRREFQLLWYENQRLGLRVELRARATGS
ncbi:MAG TPA: hypothetical protein VEP66_03145 [Myxococcales bacterium]|nr:hypothetical protein [Myxococcales bacterium]